LKLGVFRGRDRVEVVVTPEERIIQRPLELVDVVGEIGVAPNQPAAVVGVPRTDSPAYRAGLRTFDVVIEVRGKPVRSYADLDAALSDNHGETIPVGYLRPTRVPDALGKMAELSVFESGVA
jgi:regulator of sigma E protease